MKCAKEVLMQEAMEITWGWSTDDNDSILFHSIFFSTSAVWGGLLKELPGPEPEETLTN
jgi:hypothetical protein